MKCEAYSTGVKKNEKVFLFNYAIYNFALAHWL
jgi:hypothetical protein